MTIEELIKIIPEGYGFCLRDDTEKGFMANVYFKEGWNNEIAIEGKDYFPVFGNDLNKALEEAVAKARSAMN
jgi:hypothetical protein